jgi:hypothetical protein
VLSYCVFSYCGHGLSQLVLPSWIPDWSLKDPDTVIKVIDQVWNVNEAHKKPDSSATEAPKPQLYITRDLTPILLVNGYRVTAVDTTSEVRDDLLQNQADGEYNGSGQPRFLRLATKHIVKLASIASFKGLNICDDAIWRTLTCTLSPLELMSDYKVFKVVKLKSSFNNILTMFQGALAYAAGRAPTFDTREEDMALCVPRIARFMEGRISFATETGLICAGPVGMRVGDVVCNFLGGSVPYILRPIDGEHILIGECKRLLG